MATDSITVVVDK